MAIGGIFIHRSETATVAPATQAYIAVRATIGKIEDPNMVANWKKAGVDPKKMMYCYPDVDPAVTVYENASFLEQAINNLQAYQGSYWKDNPLIVYIEHPFIDLMWVSTFVEYVYSNLLQGTSGKKVALYCTPKKWNAIQIDTSAGIAIRTSLLNRCELFISDYGASVLPALNSVAPSQVHFWEYKAGFFEYKADGNFMHFADFATSGSGTDNSPADTGTGTSGGTVVVSSAENLKLGCLKIAVDIGIHNAGNKIISLDTIDAITQLADKMLIYVKKE